jgi:hypothetical protein
VQFRVNRKQLEAPVDEWKSIGQLVQVIVPLIDLYFPVTHAEQTPPFGPVNPALHVQALITVLELGELELEGQAKHTDDVVAPTVPEYVPAPQSVHATLPIPVLYLPATHPEQTPPSGPVNPALQVQAPLVELELGEVELEGQARHTDDVVAPTVPEYVPTPQSVHATLPPIVLYFPATHAAQVPPFGPVNPALQEQALMDVLELGELELEGHNVHAALPLVDLYLPATHPEQTPPSGPVNPALQVQA